MKRFLLIVVAACLAVTLASCGAGDLSTSSAPAEDTVSSQVSEAPMNKEYSEDLAGLIQKLTDAGFITGAGAPMRADFIGAFEGYRFVNGGLSIELYQYDPNGLTDVSKKCIAEAKETNQVTVLDTYDPVPACLSDNEKYLMFYKDTATGEEADARRAQAEEIVRDFP